MKNGYFSKTGRQYGNATILADCGAEAAKYGDRHMDFAFLRMLTNGVHSCEVRGPCNAFDGRA